MKNVTILILIDGFLQFGNAELTMFDGNCHNPYFNRWFSAISDEDIEAFDGIFVTILILIDGFLQ